MSKTLQLTIGERLAALKIFDTFKGSLATLAVLLEDVKQFNVTDEEWAEANLVKTPNADGTATTWKWEEPAEQKEIVLQDASKDFLVDEIKKKSDGKEVTLADVPLITLEQKLTA